MPACCRNFSEYYVMFANGLLIFLSLVIMGLGGYLVANVGETLSDLDLGSPLVATVVFGVFLFFFSLCGILATIWDNKILLGVYIIGTLFLTVGILASGAALLVYTGSLENIQAVDLQSQLETVIIDYELAVFSECCAVPGSGFDKPKACPETEPVFPCITDVSQFETFEDLIGNTTCDVFTEFGVVGTQEGECGDGNAGTFVQDISRLIEDNMYTLGAANVGLAVFMLLLTITACVILFTDDKDDE